jgi:hypothetical protein
MMEAPFMGGFIAVAAGIERLRSDEKNARTNDFIEADGRAIGKGNSRGRGAVYHCICF